MKKVSIIYWSNGGNVEILANAISEGVIESEAKVDIKYVADATIEDILEADAVALGSPAMLNDEIEEVDMKPFINSLSELEINPCEMLYPDGSDYACCRNCIFHGIWSAGFPEDIQIGRAHV